MYSNLSTKQKNYVTEAAYTDILEQVLSGMLIFEGFPDTVNTDFISIYKMREGLCALVDDVEQGAVGHASLANGPDLNGLGIDVIVSFDNGLVKEYKNWRTNEHVVVMFNDTLMRPDLNIGRFAAALTDVDKSMLLNIIYSRLLPIPTAKNEDHKRALNAVIDGLVKGDITKAILDTDILSDVLGQHKGVDVINITDVNNAEKLQYLSMYHDDLLRRFYQLYGMDVNGNGKLAQQSVAEIGSRQGASMIIPYNIMREAEKAVEECKHKFGWNCSVTFGKPWQYDLNNNGVLDVLEDDAPGADQSAEPDTKTEEEEQTDGNEES